MSRFRVYPIFLSLFAVASSAFGAHPELPSSGLEQRVDFWKKVYTQFGKDDIVIHDGFRVNLIYDVASDQDIALKLAVVQATLREIQANLEAPETFSPEAKHIAESIAAQGISLTAPLVDELLSKIHTQRGIKERFRDGVVRSGRHVDEFRETLKKAGVPEELALLPLVESSFENVRSKAGAVGMWQFTRGTGKSYLKITSRVDERLNPSKAAQAAARLLRDNYNALGSWPLAITAYNHGRGGMQRAQREHGSDLTAIIDNYDGPVFGYASMNFYAEFLAAVEVYNTYPQYFGDLVLERPSAPIAPTVKVASKSSPAPASKAKANAAEKYKVQRGDTLWEVAQRFGTSIRSLMEMNNLKESVIYAGQMLMVR
jgi:membrane-bound lytic murein transglycosylase D